MYPKPHSGATCLAGDAAAALEGEARGGECGMRRGVAGFITLSEDGARFISDEGVRASHAAHRREVTDAGVRGVPGACTRGDAGGVKGRAAQRGVSGGAGVRGLAEARGMRVLGGEWRRCVMERRGVVWGGRMRKVGAPGGGILDGGIRREVRGASGEEMAEKDGGGSLVVSGDGRVEASGVGRTGRDSLGTKLGREAGVGLTGVSSGFS